MSDCTCNKTVLLYLFVLTLTWKNFLGWNCLVPWRLLNHIQGGNHYSWWPETTLNIIVSRVTFPLFSSVGHFISVRIFVTVPGVMLYSFLRKRAARLCTLSVSVALSIIPAIRKSQFRSLDSSTPRYLWWSTASKGSPWMVYWYLTKISFWVRDS